MIKHTCACGKIHRNRKPNYPLCRQCKVKSGELNRPNRKQVGKGRIYKTKNVTVVKEVKIKSGVKGRQ